MSFDGQESKSTKNLYTFNQYDKDSIVKFHKNIENFRNIEKFMFGSKEKDTNIDVSKLQKLTSYTNNITNEMRANAVSKIMTAAINETAQESKADIVKLLSLSNKISLSNMSGTGEFNLSGVRQANEVKSTTDATLVQDLSSTITNEFVNNINKKFSQVTSNITEIKNKVKEGTNVGDMVTGAIDAVSNIGGKFVDAAGDVLGNVTNSSFGGSRDNTNIRKENVSETLVDTLNLNNPVSFDDVEDIQEDIKNILSQENMSKCAEEVNQSNDFKLADIARDGDINISDIQQISVVDTALKCAFNQTAINQMSDKVVRNIDKIYEQLAENIERDETEAQAGDVYALGEAGKAILVGAGEGIGTAGEGLGQGIGTASEGLGEGISTAGKGLGEGIASIGEGFMLPLTIGAAVIGVGLVFYLIMRFSGGGGSGGRGRSRDYDDYDDEDYYEDY